jgi:hypothetical protein
VSKGLSQEIKQLLTGSNFIYLVVSPFKNKFITFK